MGDFVTDDNVRLVKWTLQTKKTADLTHKSNSFVIQDRKCNLLFNSGFNGDITDTKPIKLSIDFNIKEKFNPPVNVTVMIYTNSERFQPERLTLTGEDEQMIWSSINFAIRGSLMTFEMIILGDNILKDDKSVQTSSYMDSGVLLDNLSKDFGKLFVESPNHDVEFICGQETIKAHKNVLCSRSDVFASMLRTDMKEGKTGQIRIQDMESNIFRQFLRFLYTGVLPELTIDIALMFYEAADKYNVDALKKQCADYLIDNVSPDNACEILLMADRHSDSDFKKNVIEYIMNAQVPIIAEKWTEFCKENSLLATEVLNLYCRRLHQK